MMRFIHASDLHIDSPLRGLDRYDGAPVERLRTATRSALERLVDKAVAERVDFVLLAGDIYDRDWQDFFDVLGGALMGSGSENGPYVDSQRHPVRPLLLRPSNRRYQAA